MASALLTISIKGLAASPTFRAAIPIAPEITSIWSTLKETEEVIPESVVFVVTSSPKKLEGIIPVRNAVHDPRVLVLPEALTSAPTPG